MKVVILAGGLGTRLSELTKTIPKPMVKLNGKPILIHLMEHYAKQGFKDFYIATGYKKEIIKNYFKKKISDWKVNIVDTGNGGDTITLSGGADNVDAGSGNDTIEAGANLTTADTVDGGAGTDTIASSIAMTDAIAARLSNFEILDIKGSGSVTHDVSDLTGLRFLPLFSSVGAVVKK